MNQDWIQWEDHVRQALRDNNHIDLGRLAGERIEHLVSREKHLHSAHPYVWGDILRIASGIKDVSPGRLLCYAVSEDDIECKKGIDHDKLFSWTVWEDEVADALKLGDAATLYGLRQKSILERQKWDMNRPEAEARVWYDVMLIAERQTRETSDGIVCRGVATDRFDKSINVIWNEVKEIAEYAGIKEGKLAEELLRRIVLSALKDDRIAS